MFCDVRDGCEVGPDVKLLGGEIYGGARSRRPGGHFGGGLRITVASLGPRLL